MTTRSISAVLYGEGSNDLVTKLWYPSTGLYPETISEFLIYVAQDEGIVETVSYKIGDTIHYVLGEWKRFGFGQEEPVIITPPDSDATITFTDITTNNVSTSKHGFAPKAPNDSTKFLNGLGAWTVPPNPDVTDAALSFTDITTNNVSTSKHGFVPKAPNDSTQFLNGLGQWSIPVGGGDIQSDQINTFTGGNSETQGEFVIDFGGTISGGSQLLNVSGSNPKQFTYSVSGDLTTNTQIYFNPNGYGTDTINDLINSLNGNSNFSNYGTISLSGGNLLVKTVSYGYGNNVVLSAGNYGDAYDLFTTSSSGVDGFVSFGSSTMGQNATPGNIFNNPITIQGKYPVLGNDPLLNPEGPALLYNSGYGDLSWLSTANLADTSQTNSFTAGSSSSPTTGSIFIDFGGTITSESNLVGSASLTSYSWQVGGDLAGSGSAVGFDNSYGNMTFGDLKNAMNSTMSGYATFIISGGNLLGQTVASGAGNFVNITSGGYGSDVFGPGPDGADGYVSTSSPQYGQNGIYIAGNNFSNEITVRGKYPIGSTSVLEDKKGILYNDGSGNIIWDSPASKGISLKDIATKSSNFTAVVNTWYNNVSSSIMPLGPITITAPAEANNGDEIWLTSVSSTAPTLSGFNGITQKRFTLLKMRYMSGSWQTIHHEYPGTKINNFESSARTADFTAEVGCKHYVSDVGGSAAVVITPPSSPSPVPGDEIIIESTSATYAPDLSAFFNLVTMNLSMEPLSTIKIMYTGFGWEKI